MSAWDDSRMSPSEHDAFANFRDALLTGDPTTADFWRDRGLALRRERVALATATSLAAPAGGKSRRRSIDQPAEADQGHEPDEGTTDASPGAMAEV